MVVYTWLPLGGNRLGVANDRSTRIRGQKDVNCDWSSTGGGQRGVTITGCQQLEAKGVTTKTGRQQVEALGVITATGPKQTKAKFILAYKSILYEINIDSGKVSFSLLVSYM